MEAMKHLWPAGAHCPIVFCNVVEAESNSLERVSTSVKGESSRRKRGRKTDSHSRCNPGEAKKAVCLY